MCVCTFVCACVSIRKREQLFLERKVSAKQNIQLYARETERESEREQKESEIEQKEDKIERSEEHTSELQSQR